MQNIVFIVFGSKNHLDQFCMLIKKVVIFQLDFHKLLSQLTFTCSKSTIETLEKGIKYVQS